AHAHTSHWTISNIDTVNTGLLQQGCPLQNLGRVQALGRIKLNADHELPCCELFLESCGRPLPGQDDLFFNQACNGGRTSGSFSDLLLRLFDYSSRKLSGDAIMLIESFAHRRNMTG